ncbi:nuclear transport factor 2 family protein [Saccharopolyspora indica]|uniref:nuclear transport factor 2 family protein n=1 Tax=Saccharopolyspora indica TaxID=1229659 RepID=UPI0022EA3425|nr:nuclear transport factor 2 family protein [Saccharopolyspora indica]MDA3650120.1 nuclear transport factor 2 family protein [Saccharopolyspora indica]
MAVIDPSRTWELLEKRLAVTTDERHRIVLGIVLEHMKAEAEPDLDRLMATLSPTPNYHFWHGGHDVGPEGFEGVRTYYAEFLETRTNILEFTLDRLVVDDHCVVTEGFLKMLYPGPYAARSGIPVDDESADYLVVHRQVILWPVDENGLVQGEDSYSSGPASVTAVPFDELPQAYIDLVHPSSDRATPTGAG